MNEDQQKLFDAIPASGTAAYDNVRRLLLGKGEITAARSIHALRKKKMAYTWIDANGILLVSRFPRPDGQ